MAFAKIYIDLAFQMAAFENLSKLATIVTKVESFVEFPV